MDVQGVTLYSIWYCGKRKNVSYLYILPTRDAITEIKEFVKMKYNSIKKYDKKQVEMTNILSEPNVLYFNNGSRILFSADLKEQTGYEALQRTYMSMYLDKLLFDYIFIHPWCYTKEINATGLLKKKGKFV